MQRLRTGYVPQQGPLVCVSWKLEDLGALLDKRPGAEWSTHRPKVAAFCAGWRREGPVWHWDPTFEEIKREQDDTKVEKTERISVLQQPKTDTKGDSSSRNTAPKKKEKKAPVESFTRFVPGTFIVCHESTGGPAGPQIARAAWLQERARFGLPFTRTS